MLTLAISQIKLRVQNRVSTLIIHNPPCSEPRWLPLPYHTNYSEKLTTGSLCHLYIYIYKTETFETPTIFHVSTILKKKKHNKTFLKPNLMLDICFFFNSLSASIFSLKNTKHELTSDL